MFWVQVQQAICASPFSDRKNTNNISNSWTEICATFTYMKIGAKVEKLPPHPPIMAAGAIVDWNMMEWLNTYIDGKTTDVRSMMIANFLIRQSKWMATVNWTILTALPLMRFGVYAMWWRLTWRWERRGRLWKWWRASHHHQSTTQTLSKISHCLENHLCIISLWPLGSSFDCTKAEPCLQFIIVSKLIRIGCPVSAASGVLLSQGPPRVIWIQKKKKKTNPK